jgi:hypothetical protein
MSLTHRRPESASWAVLELRILTGTVWNRLGARVFSDSPSIHLSLPDNTERPSFISTDTDASNNAPDHWLASTGRPEPGLLGSTRFSHIQRICIVIPMNWRLITPRPPNCSGLQTVGHATRHCPPLTAAVPHHRKALHSLSIAQGEVAKRSLGRSPNKSG